METSATVPLSFAPQDTFVHALSKSSLGSALFSAAEKRILAALCVGVFALPIATSAVLLRSTHTPLALSAPATQQALLQQPAGVVPGNSDELAMASYFMDKA